MDRRRGDNSLPLPALKQGTQLDILVEAMGRVNFDRAIHDRKGITERVELLTDDQHQTLKNWQVYSFPNDADFAAQKNFRKGDKLDGPAYYRATFDLEEMAKP